MPNKVITKNLNIVQDVGIPYSVNNIIGFPYETRELAFDTIMINKTFQANDRNAYPFTPFTGTPLRKVCEDLGYLDKDDIVRSMVANGSILNMPQFPRDEVNAICKTFNMYVNFPKSRWKEIERAEKNDDEGQKIYSNLSEEYKDRFWDSNDGSFEDSAENMDFTI